MVALVACRNRPPPAPAPPGLTIRLALDQRARTVAIARPIALAALVDASPATWLEVRAEATDGRRLELPDPTTTYAGSELRLYVDPRGIALGVFSPIAPDMPPEIAAIARQPVAWLTPVASVEVVTRRPAPAPAPALTLVAAGREVELTDAQLHGVALVEGEGPRLQGWPLLDVIALGAPGLVPRAIRIVGDDELALEPAAVRDPARRHLLKANQRGEYVLRVWDIGGRHPTRELRRVTRIVVE